MRKTISFTGEYKAEFEYLCSKNNCSLYVSKLIKKDRLNDKDVIETKIDKILKKLENGNIQSYSSEPDKISELKRNALKNMIDLS